MSGTTDIVLMGGGHAHVFVLKAFGMKPMANVRLTVVAKELAAPYSGMLPGFVAGHYTLDDCQIDLVNLANFAGARLIHGAAVGVDRLSKMVKIEGQAPLHYDLLSIDVGITPLIDEIEGALDHAIAVKPVSRFAPKWQALELQASQPDGPRSIVVIGGGAAGVELVLAAHHRFQSRSFSSVANGSTPFSFTLIAGGSVLPSHNRRARQLAAAALHDAGVVVIENDTATSLGPKAAILASGRVVAADAALVSTKAQAPAWFAETDMPRDPAGFLSIRPTLQLLDDDAVFAVGDCATSLDYPRPKSGVFAVRQGPVIADNLRRRAEGHDAKPFVPQTQFLSLISLGQKRAIASRGPFSAAGAWAWLLKDRIDRSFMDNFNRLPGPA
jgi:selenide, water dikinase